MVFSRLESMEALQYLPKIKPVNLSQIIVRPRLIRFLQQNEGKKLILVLGQAAQGKSTLAAAHVKESGIPSAWLTLDSEDADPINLFYLLVRSLQNTFPEMIDSKVIDYPAINLGPRAEALLYRDWAWAIFQALPSRVQIVVDGLDQLPADAASFSFLEVLIKESPSHVHFMILSRAVPPFHVQRFRMNREAVVLENGQLAFSMEEVEAFFKQLCAIDLTPEQARRIHELTEGWAGALVLFSELLRQLPDQSRQAFLSDRSVHFFKREVFQFLGEEVFSHLSPHIQDFLIKTSILDVVTPGSIDALFGGARVDELCRELSNSNLFIQSLYDPQSGCFYRYHQLFRDFLLARFKLLNEQEQQEWHYRAGSAFEQAEEPEKAIEHYLKAGADEDAARMLKKVGLSLLQRARTGDLSKWLGCLPEDRVRSDPWLLYYLSITRRFTEARENIARLNKSLHMFKEREDFQGQLLSMAHLIEASTFVGSYTTPLQSLLEEAEVLLHSGRSIPFPHERAVLWSLLGLGHRRGVGNVRKGFQTCQNAYLLARQLGDLPLEITALSNAMQDLSFLGEFTLAAGISEKLDELMKTVAHPELKATHLLHCAAFATFRGNLTEAENVLEAAQAEIQNHGLVYLYPIMLIHKLFTAVYMHDKREQVQHLAAHLFNLVSSMANRVLEGITAMFMALSAYREGRIQNCAEWIERTNSVFLSNEARSDFHFHATKALRSLIAYHTHDDHGAQEDLLEVLKYCEEISCYILKVDALWILALLKHQLGRTEDAALCLEAGFKIAQERHYNHFIVLSPRDFARVAALTIELHVSEAVGYAAHLLATRFAPWASEEMDRLKRQKSRRTKPIIMEIERTIHRSHRPRLRIVTLGSFQVLRDGTEIDGSQLAGNQPKRLLKAIAAKGWKPVHGEVLAESLWPGRNTASGEQNLTVNLHRLRKALEPDMHKSFGSSYLHLKDNLLILDKELCSIDAEEFESLFRNGKKKERQNDLDSALSCYLRALELYREDFLPEEPYSDWAAPRRDELRKQYISILTRAAEIHGKRGEGEKAIPFYEKIIRTDPLMESGYRKLMLAYRELGMRNEALRVFNDCKEALRAGLGSEPDEKTAALYLDILNGRDWPVQRKKTSPSR